MKVKIKKLADNAVIPAYAHNADAGLDLVATSKAYDADGNVVYGTGLAMEIPDGYVGLVFPRSSIARKHTTLTNAVGVIDSGYRGEIMAKFKPTLHYHNGFIATGINPNKDEYEVGDRIAQIIILPYPKIEFEMSDTLNDSDRGTGGYGSTNKKKTNKDK